MVVGHGTTGGREPELDAGITKAVQIGLYGCFLRV